MLHMKLLALGAVAAALAMGGAPARDGGSGTAPGRDPVPMIDLGFDTHYIPLPDINSGQVAERPLGEDQVEANGAILDKTPGLEKLLSQSGAQWIVPDGKGNYIAASTVGGSHRPSDIRIAIYDPQGGKTAEKTYGGSDFDSVYDLKFNAAMGIVISGLSQSRDGDFANNSNSPFVACIDAETLAVKWFYPTQSAGEPFAVTDDAVFVVHSEGTPYRGGELKLSVVRLDAAGKKVWQTEPLSQWLHDVKVLADGSVIVVQRYAHSAGNDGLVTVYDQNGALLTTLKADCYGRVFPTSDGGFIMVSVREIKTVPQPAYLSSIWMDTETVAAKYGGDYQVEWRKTYDQVKDAVGLDRITPQKDGSVIVAADPARKYQN